VGELVSINQLIWHIVAFILFAIVLYRMAWKPILGMIDARKDAIDRSFGEAEAKQAAAVKLQEEYELKLREIQEEATRRIQDAIKRGEEIAAEIKSGAEAEREKLLAKAAADVERAREIARAELRNEVVNLTFAVSEKLLKDPSVLDRKAHLGLLERYLGEVESVR
jgi:F-type H+-transporting ATPase subunit b